MRLDDLYQRYVHRDPVGVCALISPWNAPLMLATSKIAPALAFGNCCVIKASEYTPLAIALHGAPCRGRRAAGRGEPGEWARPGHRQFAGGAPRGGHRFLHGRRHGGPKHCGFCREALEEVRSGTGGKSANIVSDSADLDQAVDGSLAGIYGNTGQMCFAGSRILLQRGIAEAFLERFTARARDRRG
ncbi:aldehyde dehydrogenase family protein [Polaromonas sp. P2-4]|nr:aldehyde dehydrogenase family protein [Polaromonas sp. P2-4]